ncbi:manganese efflux pump MntP family protein [Nocardioides albus]|uniref:Putative manganese efflux pump MntP n=1 Tax=Nocardioides albus TaxID=1841 RepID=A0A7W5F984_9ACTN|nr:manganese efflux pump MntP family protein [Nocardioides albus]MBB3089727.1 putative Mn2+ efflux pump MntP [Nocardioides albus]GGU35171.1 putative manganese efflux pump MntP 2 [Nocardioides albus]
MSLWAIFLIGIGVSADAFAAAVTCGLRLRRWNLRQAIIVAAVFAGFQAAMPLMGWAVASRFSRYVDPVDHWIAFTLLAAIGAKMIWEAFQSDGDEEAGTAVQLGIRRLLLLGVATSIDAAAVGVSFAVLDVSILQAILIIAVTTFTLSLVGVVIGNRVGARFRTPAEIVGGLVLIAIGVRIVLEHFIA